MSSRRLEDLHPDLHAIADAFLARCKAAGLDILITCTYRSGAEQDALYAQGRTTPGKIVTRAKAGQSAHNATDAAGKPAARAFDIVPLRNGKAIWTASDPAWATAGAIGMELGLVWYGAPGSKFKESPHFQLRA